MAVYNSGKTIKMARMRKKMTQEQLLNLIQIYSLSIYRWERGIKVPSYETIKEFNLSIDFPSEEFLCTHLENQPLDSYWLREQLHNALYSADIDVAETILSEIEKRKGFDEGRNLQLVLSARAELLELRGYPLTEILPLIQKGLALTYENFSLDDIGKQVLLFEEPALCHTLAARMPAREIYH